MTAPALFLERSMRGVRLSRLRLVGEDFEADWASPSTTPPEDLPAEAGAWVVRTLAEQRLPKRLSLLVVDTDGASCAWVAAPGGDARVVPALVRQGALAGAAGEESGFTGSTSPGATLGADIDLPGAGSIESWAAESPGQWTASEAGAEVRFAAVAVPDAAARVLLDVLDASGVRVGAVQSLWHASASAWARPVGRRSSDAQEERVVAEADAPLIASVVVEPRGRLNWCWASSGGVPIAAGSMRLGRASAEAPALEDREGEAEATALAPARRNGAPGLAFGATDAGRLAADWLGWAAQLGASPRRVRIVLPSVGGPEPGAMGAAIGEAWPDAAIELITDEDPVARTIRSAAGRVAGEDGRADAPDGAVPERELLGLSLRPGRDHRSAHRWLAVGLASLAVVVGLVGVAFSRARDGLGAEATRFVNAWREAVTASGADRLEPVGAANAVMVMEQLVSTERARLAPRDEAPALMDVMSEVELLAGLLGNDFVEIRTVEVNQTQPRLNITVSDLTMFSMIQDSLRDIPGSRIIWTRAGGQQTGGQLNYTGRWVTTDPSRRN